MTRLVILLIRTYQKVSPTILPKTCRFHPSCSQYALEALQKYGFCKGILRALRRILRCSPLSTGGYDPLK